MDMRWLVEWCGDALENCSLEVIVCIIGCVYENVCMYVCVYVWNVTFV